MTLPAPNLDDRRFQDLVDDAKLYVQRSCPEWSDHNVSDPGVTLIETYAMVVDQLLYRLNQVPDRLYLKFLELLGMPLHAPTPATAATTFWLSAQREHTVTVPAGTEVATQRTETDQALSFTTTESLAIVACKLVAIATEAGTSDRPVNRTTALRTEQPFEAFSREPATGDKLLIGLSVAVPRCAVALRFACPVQGVGVEPHHPPLIWEAYIGGNVWVRCEVEYDQTGGLNKSGDVVLHVPAEHQTSAIAGQEAGWLRCQVVDTVPNQSPYTKSPQIEGASAFTTGGTIDAAYSEIIHNEVIGVSDEVPGQRFPLAHRPVVAGSELVVQVGAGDEQQEWHKVTHFAASGPADRHFVLDPIAGEIVFGPGVRQPDDQVRYYGAIPKRGAAIKIASYRVGGGRRGNVARGAITALRASVPYVSRVENRRPASGGVDGEDVDNAKRRAPLFLRARQRAVTAADYESLACEADPRAARVRCVPGQRADPAVVRLLVVPALPGEPSKPVDWVALQPRRELLETIAAYLDERRVLGTQLLIRPPTYRLMTAVATVRLGAFAAPDRVTQDVLGALYRYLHPLCGGPDGSGWPFGRTVQAGELLAAAQRVAGVDVVEDVKLYLVDPQNWRHIEGARIKLDLEPDTLPFAVKHVVELASS